MMVFNTISDLVASKLKAGTPTDPIVVKVLGSSVGATTAAEYWIKTAAQASTDGDTIDNSDLGYDLANIDVATVAVLKSRDIPDSKMGEWDAKLDAGDIDISGKWDDATTTLGGDHTATGDWDFTGLVTQSEAKSATDLDVITNVSRDFSFNHSAIGAPDINSSYDAVGFSKIGTGNYLQIASVNDSSLAYRVDDGGGFGEWRFLTPSNILVRNVVGSQSINRSDLGKILVLDTTSTTTLTTAQDLTIGFSVLIVNLQGGTVNIAAYAGTTIDETNSVTIDDSKRFTTVIKVTANKYITAGNVS